VDCRGGSDRAVNQIELNRIDSFVALNRIIFFFAESPITSSDIMNMNCDIKNSEVLSILGIENSS